MKKLALAIAVLIIPSFLWAAGSVTQVTPTFLSADKKSAVYQITWVGDSSDGTVPDTKFKYDVRGYILYAVEFVPVTTNITSGFDTAISRTFAGKSFDVCKYELLNNTAPTLPNFVTLSEPFLIDETLTYALKNNSQASASGKSRLLLIKP